MSGRRGAVALALVVVLGGFTSCAPASPPPTPQPIVATASATPFVPPTPLPSWAATKGIGDDLDPALGNPGYDATHYELDLAYQPAAPTLNGRVTMTATATAALETVNLDFIGWQVDGVTVDGAKAEVARSDRDLIVRPGTPIAKGRTFHVEVRYHGRPERIAPAGGSPVQLGWTIVDGGRTSYVMSEPDGARGWFPCNDHPSDKATYTFRVTVPTPYVAAANGVLVSSKPSGPGTEWTWEMTDPMASYLAGVVVSDEFTLEEDAGSTKAAGVAVRNFLPAELQRDPAVLRQGEMIAYLGSIFGPFPFHAYGIARAPEFPGGMENQTLTLIGTPPSEWILVHELAHSWFGDYVSVARWQDIWLNEGFATYAEWLWAEHTGEASIAQSAQLEYERLNAMAPFAGLGAVSPPGKPPLDSLFNRGVYGRGGLTLYALRAAIGDAAFFATLREWVKRYGGRSATTEQFIALAEQESGRKLATLFDAWLYAEAMPPLPGAAASPSPPATTPVEG